MCPGCHHSDERTLHHKEHCVEGLPKRSSEGSRWLHDKFIAGASYFLASGSERTDVLIRRLQNAGRLTEAPVVLLDHASV